MRIEAVEKTKIATKTKEPFGEDWHIQATFKSLDEFGRSAIRFVLLSNGGALIAILSFFGSIYDQLNSIPTYHKLIPAIIFISGVFLGGLAFAGAYMTQLTLYDETIEDRSFDRCVNHMFYLWCSVAFVITGILCFLFGATTFAILIF